MGGTSSVNNRPPYNLFLNENEELPKLYQLVDLFGGGRLVELMKEAMRTKNFDEVDKCIRTEVKEYLYNEGNGDHISIDKLVLNRLDPKRREKLLLEEEKKRRKLEKSVPEHERKPKVYETRFICFDINKRGRIGETLFHLCFLNATQTHNELAKRMLKYFPKLLNDIFLSEDYYGQTALHLAIVNEDPKMVRFLLSVGADVNQRCVGKFFCPDDQLKNRKDTLDSEYPILPKNSNYKGIAYFGEYPLSFAGTQNIEECVRLLLARGADPNKQDTNGNTILHLLVISDNLEMLEVVMNLKIDFNLTNSQGLTPLTLAAQLGKNEIFLFFLEKIRQFDWIYGNISSASYPLVHLDTIQPNGDIDRKSALMLIVNSRSDEHLEMFEGVVLDLLNKKWTLYIKFKFYIELLFFLIYFIVCSITLMLKRIYYDYLNSKECLISEHTTYLISKCACTYLTPHDSDRYVRTTFEFISVLMSLAYFLKALNEFYVQRLFYWKTLIENPFKFGFVISNICILIIVPMRFVCVTYGEDLMVVLALLLQSCYVIYLARGFKITNTFVFCMQRILGRDFVTFVLIYAIFIMGFSQSFYIAFNYGNAPVEDCYWSPLQSILDTVGASVNDFEILFPNLEKTDYEVVGKIVMTIFTIIVGVLLINLLIAMMINTYEDVNELKNEWIRQWANQILTLELNLDNKERLKQQAKYSINLKEKGRAMVVHWKQTVSEREELVSDYYENVRQKLVNSKDLDEFLVQERIKRIITINNTRNNQK